MLSRRAECADLCPPLPSVSLGLSREPLHGPLPDTTNPTTTTTTTTYAPSTTTTPAAIPVVRTLLGRRQLLVRVFVRPVVLVILIIRDSKEAEAPLGSMQPCRAAGEAEEVAEFEGCWGSGLSRASVDLACEAFRKPADKALLCGGGLNKVSLLKISFLLRDALAEPPPPPPPPPGSTLCWCGVRRALCRRSGVWLGVSLTEPPGPLVAASSSLYSMTCGEVPREGSGKGISVLLLASSPDTSHSGVTGQYDSVMLGLLCTRYVAPPPRVRSRVYMASLGERTREWLKKR
ncbi:hypothetical protein CRUP_034665 [Coryphaenoides rupestris]|nr:hypothetical protein CRUP_034665 [Coryphaenoides rupestris]